ncbi:hypothetical protein MMC30_009281 [Trapelia coarctata]|nr:hypothetical protein [Trapelia coarctata]
MIPSGEFLVNGDSTTDAHGVTKLKLHFPPNTRTRKFYLPALFRSGTCLIKVVADIDRRAVMRSNLNRAGLPSWKNAASQMYSVVWPNVRKEATRMVERGHFPNSVKTQSLMGEATFPYKITVEVAGQHIPHDGSTYIDAVKEGPRNRYSNEVDTWSAWDYDHNHNKPYNIWEVEYNVYEPGGSSSGHGRRKGIARSFSDKHPLSRRPAYYGRQD